MTEALFMNMIIVINVLGTQCFRQGLLYVVILQQYWHCLYRSEKATPHGRPRAFVPQAMAA
jgi:hypothetical protein